MGASVNLELLGRFLLEIDGREVAVAPGSRQQRLLAYLLLRQGERVPRSRVAGALWPEVDESQARRRLSDALYLLRRCLPPDRFAMDKQFVALNLSFADRCDLSALDALLQQGEPPLDRLLAFEGERLLPDLDDEWAIHAAMQMRDRFTDRVESLSRDVQAKGRHEEALALLDRVVEIDPLRESAYRGLMVSLGALGRRAEGLDLYAKLMARLRDELGTLPADETRAVERSLRRPERPGGRERMASRLPLVGRDRERELLLALLDRAAHGWGGLMLIEAEAGVGKTRLLEELAADARWRSFQVGVGAPAGHHLLLALLDEMLTPLRVQQVVQTLPPRWRRQLAKRLPKLGVGVPPSTCAGGGSADQLTEPLSHLLIAMARASPLLLVLDDMHEASPEDWELLLHISQTVVDNPVFVVAAYRPGPVRAAAEVWRLVQRIGRRASDRPIELGPLSAGQSRQLLHAALGAIRARDADRLHRLTSGNPLFLLQSLSALLERRRITNRGGEWQLADDALADIRSVRIEDAVAVRLEQLGAASRELMRLSSLDPEPLALETLVAISTLTGPEVVARAQELVNRRLWAEAPTGYLPAHDLIREVVLAAIPDDERERLHRELLSLLRDADGVSWARIGLHAYGARDWKLAATALEAAAGEAERQQQYFYGSEYATRALEAHERLGDADPTEATIRLLLLRQRLSIWTARPEEQRADLDRLEALLGDDHPERPRFALASAEWLAERGRHDEATAYGELALELATRQRQHAIQARTHVFLARESQRRGDQRAFRTHADEGLALAEKHGIVDARLSVVNMVAIARHYAGELGLAKDGYEEVRRVAEEHGLTGIALTAASNLGAVEQALGHEHLAIDIYEQVVERCERLVAVDPYDVVNLSFLQLSVGQFERAEASLDRADSALRDRASAASAAFAAMTRGYLELERMHRDAACPHLKRAIDLGEESRSGQVRSMAQVFSGLYHLERGELADAESALLRGIEACAEMGVTIYDSMIHALCANVEVRADRPDRAEASIQRASGALDVSTLPVRSLYYIGLAEEALGGAHRAAPTFRRALRLVDEKAAELPEDLRASFEAMPRVKAIRWAARRMDHPDELVRLPWVGAPTGRPPRPCEQVDVLWVADEGDGPDHRRRVILALVDQAYRQEASPTLKDLGRFLGVSPATIGRDLQVLRRSDAVVSTRGS